MSDKKVEDNQDEKSLSESESKAPLDTSRRKFLRTTGIAAGGVLGGAVLGGLFNPFQTKETSKEVIKEEVIDYSETRLFFKQKIDFDVLSLATERIFPEDEHGPGAIKLGVPYFIDKQLAGSWGKSSEVYMQTPFRDDEVPLKREQLFLQGVRRINEVSLEQFDEDFAELEVEQQNSILQSFEKDEVDMEFVQSSDFFSALRQSVMEGCYSDPIHGGNKNMDGWRMKEYPGVQMSHQKILEEEEFIVIEPKSLKDHEAM